MLTVEFVLTLQLPEGQELIGMAQLTAKIPSIHKCVESLLPDLVVAKDKTEVIGEEAEIIYPTDLTKLESDVLAYCQRYPGPCVTAREIAKSLEAWPPYVQEILKDLYLKDQVKLFQEEEGGIVEGMYTVVEEVKTPVEEKQGGPDVV